MFLKRIHNSILRDMTNYKKMSILAYVIYFSRSWRGSTNRMLPAYSVHKSHCRHSAHCQFWRFYFPNTWPMHNTVRPWDKRFFGTRKFGQLELLHSVMAKSSKKLCSLRFSIHKPLYLKLFWTQLENVHMQGPCCLKPCSSRPYCTVFP